MATILTWLLIVVAVVLVLACVIHFFRKRDRLAFSDYINLLVLLVSIAALRVAAITVANSDASSANMNAILRDQRTLLRNEGKTLEDSNDALRQSVGYAKETIQALKTSTSQQSKLLDAASNALRSEVSTALAQQQLLTESLGVSRKNLTLAQSEYAQQQALQQSRPQIEFALENSGWAIAPTPTSCLIAMNSQTYKQLSFYMRNVGSSALTHVVVNVLALPSTVRLAPEPSRQINSESPNVVQNSALDLVHGTSYIYHLDLWPVNASMVRLIIQVSGENAVINSEPVPPFHATFDCKVQNS